MLTPKFRRESINADTLKEFYLQDITGNHGEIVYIKNNDGTYTQSTNDWGYGAPNPARNTLAVLFVSVHRQEESDVIILPYTYDPLDGAVERVSFPYPKDGYYQHYQFAIDLFVEGTVYNVGDKVFFPDPNVDTYRGYTKELQSDGTWLTLSIEDLIEKYKDLKYKNTLEDVLMGKALAIQGELDAKRRRIATGKDKCDSNLTLKKEYELFILIREARSAKCANYFPLAEEYLSVIEDI